MLGAQGKGGYEQTGQEAEKMKVGNGGAGRKEVERATGYSATLQIL